MKEGWHLIYIYHRKGMNMISFTKLAKGLRDIDRRARMNTFCLFFPDSIVYPWFHDLLQILPFYINLEVICFPPVGIQLHFWVPCVCVCMYVYVCAYAHMYACIYKLYGCLLLSVFTNKLPGLCFSS